uniref:Uncharacterized protein n=1 Tax=Panagrellus redivivus TaxID=6233 RepID=A0A7E4VEU7_PANRE
MSDSTVTLTGMSVSFRKVKTFDNVDRDDEFSDADSFLDKVPLKKSDSLTNLVRLEPAISDADQSTSDTEERCAESEDDANPGVLARSVSMTLLDRPSSMICPKDCVYVQVSSANNDSTPEADRALEFGSLDRLLRIRSRNHESRTTEELMIERFRNMSTPIMPARPLWASFCCMLQSDVAD